MSSLFFTSTEALATPPPTTTKKERKRYRKQKDMQDLCSGMNSLTNINFLNRTNKVQVLNVAQLAYRMPSTNEC